MLFNVSGLIQEGIGATREHTVQGTLTSPEHGSERIGGTVNLLRTKDGVLVRANMKLVEPETCSRCLKPLEETLSIDFEEEFQATTDVRSGQPVRQPTDPDAFKIDENHMLDLTEAVRQYREASAAMQPLCRPDCRGLCPQCGRDLNLGDCDCQKGITDSRWEGLAELLGKTRTEEDGRSMRPNDARRRETRPRRSRLNATAPKGKD
jgi:uncharacterized protein